MPSDHPQTPESPSQASSALTDIRRKTSTSPHFTNSLPTPAHSVNGSMSALGVDNMSSGFAQGDVSNKRKRELEDSGDRDQKKAHVQDTELSIADLHLDVGDKFLLCKTPHPKHQPELSQDLFKLYSLTQVAASVARVNPDGTKNPLRKTYKKYIKTLNINGAFDVSRKEPEDPDTLMAMMQMDDDAWDAQSEGQEITRGFSERVNASISGAFKMAKGQMPKSRWDSSVLGVNDTKMPLNAVKVPPNHLPQKIKGHVPNAPTQQGEGNRTGRRTGKRSYTEQSFEGYGDGFPDDDNQDTGYSTGDGDDRRNRKRPKKSTAPHGYQGPMRQSSYGPGMVGA